MHTPGIIDIERLAEYLNMNSIVHESHGLSADNEKPVVVFIRYDLQVNEVKIRERCWALKYY